MGNEDLKKKLKLALRFLPDKAYLKLYYFLSFKRRCNLKDPKTFNEKMQWLKLYDRNPKYIPLVDKYEVRAHIARMIGEEYLTPLVGGPWDRVEDIDFERLPDQFVLKCTHDSGGNIICKDKQKLDIAAAKKKLKKALKCDYYKVGREWPYKDVPRRIICEQYLSNDGDNLTDYKIHCFDGEPKFILVSRDRFSETGLTEDYYTEKWERMDLTWGNYPTGKTEAIKPAMLQEMLEFSRILSKGHPFLRVDYYVIGDQLYFGELTLFPASGCCAFTPEKWDRIFGEWIPLPGTNCE